MAFDPRNRAIKDYIDNVLSLAGTRGVAAGTGDNTEIVGPTIDRASFGYAKSAVFVIAGSATLTSGLTLTMKSVAVEHDDDSAFGSGADHATYADRVSLTGISGGAAQNFREEYEVDLSGAERYIRMTATPDLSHTGTDIFTIAGVAVLGGQDTLPT
jgi:hypothetical protein